MKQFEQNKEENNKLQLRDYVDVYIFLVRCKNCNFTSYNDPKEIIKTSEDAPFWYIDEIETKLKCSQCKSKKANITPMTKRKKHNFVGGMP